MNSLLNKPKQNWSMMLIVLTSWGWIACLVGCHKPSPLANRPSLERYENSIDKYVGNEPILPIFAETDLDQEIVALGKLLFHDKRLSKDDTISCADCHKIAQGGDDGKIKAVGYRKQIGTLNTPTVINSGLYIAQFWDGRVDTLEEQIPGPVHNPIEMATNWEQVIDKLTKDASVIRKFRRAYNEGISSKLIIDAIATYERALVTENSPFDHFLMGNENAISQEAREGYRLFKEIGCISCHQGRAVGGNMFQTFGIMDDYFKDKETNESDRGRINVTDREQDLHRFKVPSLRTAIATAPYFHDGNAATLEEAVAQMAKIQLGTSLTDEEISHIVEFIGSLYGQLAENLQ